jgi:hypothetical protein
MGWRRLQQASESTVRVCLGGFAGGKPWFVPTTKACQVNGAALHCQRVLYWHQLRYLVAHQNLNTY